MVITPTVYHTFKKRKLFNLNTNFSKFKMNKAYKNLTQMEQKGTKTRKAVDKQKFMNSLADVRRRSTIAHGGSNAEKMYLEELKLISDQIDKDNITLPTDNLRRSIDSIDYNKVKSLSPLGKDRKYVLEALRHDIDYPAVIP